MTEEVSKASEPLQSAPALACNKDSSSLLRRGCSELYRMPVSEYKGSSSDSGSFEYKFPFRSNNNKWQRTSSSPQQSLTASPQPHTPNRAISLGSSVGKTLSAERLERGAVIPRSVSSDGRPLDTKRFGSFIFVNNEAWMEYVLKLFGFIYCRSCKYKNWSQL